MRPGVETAVAHQDPTDVRARGWRVVVAIIVGPSEHGIALPKRDRRVAESVRQNVGPFRHNALPIARVGVGNAVRHPVELPDPAVQLGAHQVDGQLAG